MVEPLQLLVFRIDEQRYALPLGDVERVVRAVEVTPLPGAPAIILGVVGVGNRIIPVLNLRRRFELPEWEIGLADHFVIARTSRRAVALVVDEAQEVITCPDISVTDGTDIVPGVEQFQGVLKLPDGLILIQDIGRCLSLDEERELSEAMRPAAHAG